MAGLARICKMYGGMEINGKKYVWDYARDEAVPEDEMPNGSDRHRESEKAMFKALQQEIDNARPAAQSEEIWTQ